MAGRIHELGSERVHTRFKAEIEPILEIDPGDIVRMECREGFDGQVDPPITPQDLDNSLFDVVDFRRLAPVTGPVGIRGAEPGDCLEVRIIELVPFGIGNLIVFPSWMEADFITSDQRRDFPEAWIRRFDMDEAAHEGAVQFRPGLSIPLVPMLGVIGTAPAQGDFTTTGPPRYFGGNMDIHDIRAGSRVYLPVSRPGALFSAGDGHGVQGDGEICTTGLETPIRATLEFQLHKMRSIPGPQIDTGEEFMTVAYGRTLDQAAQRAIGYMIDYLAGSQHLTRHEAYGLLSLAGNLRINQVVDFPHLGARVAIRKDLFQSWTW
jgi:acetamidase/formamidase